MKRKSSPKKPIERQPSCPACNGLCCRHIALEIDKPKRKADFENIRWYLMHETVKVGIDHDGGWLIEVPVSCRHLKDHACTIYKKRPDICKEYPGDDWCEHEDKSSPYKVLFADDAAFERYLAGKKKEWPTGKRRHKPEAHFTHTTGPLLP
jgi:Fe-S-cluster containining protein